MPPSLIKHLSIVVTTLIPWLLCAGTLDDAPFRIVVPSGEWQIEDSTAQGTGKDIFIAATLSNTNTLLKSVVFKMVLKNASDSSLDEFFAGVRNSFTNRPVKEISERDTTFLGHKAKALAYQVTKGDRTTYNEVTVFIADGKGWAIACVGRPDQKDEIKKIIGFYRKKPPRRRKRSTVPQIRMFLH